ncbi:unnamed protein product, partial [Oppiella nova]
MFMIMETEDDFSFERKAQMDANNPKVQEWEQLMWTFQKSLPFAKQGLDLKDDPKVIEEYDRYHRNVWPEMIKSLKDSGVVDMEIYRLKNRLILIME